MNGGITSVIYYFAEKLKHTGKIRGKIKALLSPCYQLVCRILWRGGVLYLYHIELPVTLKCSLRCKECCFMMPYFAHPVDYDVDKLLDYMDKLFDCVDIIQIFRILGGEPFLYPDLDRIIDKALSSSKVKTVDIVTNGTILPKPELLEHMKNARLTVQISDYGDYSRQKEALKAACDAAGVRCVLRGAKEKTWVNVGSLEFRGRTKKELQKQLRHCATICRSFNNGRLYYCPRPGFGAKLGMPDTEAEYVDFTGDKTREELRKEIYQLNQCKYLTACNYCDQGTELCKKVPVAEQME